MSMTKIRPTPSTKTRTRGGKRAAVQRSKIQLRFFVPIFLVLCASLLVWGLSSHIFSGGVPIDNPKVEKLSKLKIPSWIDKEIISKDSDSRRGEYLEDITGIVIHYVGNPGTSAAQNRNYYANPGTEVNSHFVIGLDGEILQCLPLEEKSSASNERNRDTISIEVCHPDERGAFTEKSYASLLQLTTWLCQKANLTPEQVIRHYDVTGKLCPIYFVQHPEAWQRFQDDLKQSLRDAPNAKDGK